MLILNIIYILLLSFLINPQNNVIQPVKLQVVDEETYKPISDCAIICNDTIIGVTSKDGIYISPDNIRNSKIILRHLSYDEKEVDLSLLPSNTVYIPLRIKQYGIEEVSIKTSKRKVKYVKMGITKTKVDRSHVGVETSYKVALYIKNSNPSIDYFINQVCIYIHKNGIPNAPFLLTLLNGENQTLPPDDSNIIFGPILLQANQGGEYFNFYLSENKIEMPKNGLYVVIENPQINPMRYKNNDFKNINPSLLLNTFRIGFTMDEVNKFYWWVYDVNGWRCSSEFWENSPYRNITHIGNPMIYVKLQEIH